MRIAIDMDGTIRDVYAPLKKELEKDGYKVDPIKDWTDYRLTDHIKKDGYNITLDELRSLWFNNYASSCYLHNALVYKYSKEALNIMREDGHKVIMITASPNIYIAGFTIEFLSQQGLSFNEYLFTEYTTKHLIDADLFIEDSPYQWENLTKNNKRVVLIDRPWNRNGDAGTFAKRYKNLIEAYYNEKD